MKIAVVGTGYVGLVTAVCLAHWGHTVACVETDRKKLSALKAGRSPIFEQGVEELMHNCAERLSYTDSCGEACADAQAVFICVGTPARDDGFANLKQVFTVAEEIAACACRDCVCVVKSTVPIGTNLKLDRLFFSRTKRGVSIETAANPEFLSQGTAVRDFLSGPRVVIGVESAHSGEILKRIYADYHGKIIMTDRQTAEMIKYASNNFLALKISYINEIANLCEIVGADVETVARGMGADSRIGDKFLRAGIGYGGSCFPKDTKALHWLAKHHDYEIKTVKAAIEVNENQKIRLIQKAHRYYPNLEGLTVAVLGLTFKPGTDDLRDAPSIPNIAVLLQEGAKIRVWDPSGYERINAVYPGQLTCCGTIEEAVGGAHLCLILTEWKQIREFDPAGYEKLMKKPVVIDGRNCYSRDAAQKAGIAYDCIGRPRILPRSWTEQAGRVLSLPVHSRKTASASVMSLQTSV
ncbi:MAG TPA: UDP-glucose 6-dehydrogenase [Ruminococcaceae bacterium]|nr:UDP-glucose 6-dehydrogenase [Oscillospiraceae bacterium]